MPKKQITDHEGNTFESIADLCTFWNIKRSTFESRYYKGWDMKDCILLDHIDNSIKITDHTGHVFKNKQEMCDFWKINRSTFDNRISRGYSIEKALTEPFRNNEYIDPEGNKFKSIKDMANHWDMNYTTLSKRLNDGMTVEDALKPVCRECMDHKGTTFKSFNAMCEHYNITRSTVERRLKNGESLEAALTRPSTTYKTFTDHTGETFKTFGAMCKKWNIPSSTVQNRIYKLGMSIEEALTSPVKTQHNAGKKCYDHLGNEYSSIATMCCAYGIPRNVYHRRRKDGWDLEKSLTTPPSRKNGQGRTIYDHLGNAYLCVGEMCNAYGLDYGMYGSRIRQGWSLEKTLTTPPSEITMGKTECVDHKGNHFKSQNEMMRFWGISKHQLRSRIELGWTLEQILESPEHQSHKHPCVDHLGNEWPSQEEMLAHYGVDPTKFRHRLNVQGCTLEEALTKGSLHKNKVTDPLGNEFECESDMCAFWNVPTATYYHWINKLHPGNIAAALTRPKANWHYKDVTIIKTINKNFFEILYKDTSYIWSLDQICDYFIKNYERGETFD